MRSIAVLFLALFLSSLTFANDVNISTVTKSGTTLFYLQAGAFSLEKDAKARQLKHEKAAEDYIKKDEYAKLHLYGDDSPKKAR